MPTRNWSSLVSAAILVATLGLAVPAFANIGFQPVSPEELKMTSEPQAPGAPAIVLFRQVDRDDRGISSHEDDYVRVKILTEEGRKYADVELAYDRDLMNVTGIKARTIRPDGTIVNFEGKAFDKTIAKAKGVKYLAKTFTLPDVQVGSIIEYSYSLDFAEYSAPFSHWILSNELFTKSAKFSLKPYAGENWSIRWTWQFLPTGTNPPKQGNDSVIRLETSNIPAFKTEDYMPPENELKSRVDFIYSTEYIKEQDKYWESVGKKWNSTVESFINKRKAMEEAVAQIVSPSDSPEVKLQKIYERVQQFRNTSYEVEKTEKEQKREKQKQAENVEQLWKAGYGNGTALTWLFLALSRAAGFQAYGAWVSDRNNYFFRKETMDGNRLDANVVVVQLNGKNLYFDPGAKFTPFGLLPWTETGVQGLMLDKDGGKWILTTLPESKVSQITRTADLKLVPETGSLEGKLTVTYTGLEAMSRRVEERNEDETARKKYLEEEVKEYIPVAVDVELTKNPNWASSSNSLVAEFDVKIPGWVSGAGRRALLPVGLFGASEKHLFDHAERVHPIYFQFPSQKVDDITVELPPGWKIATLPQEQSADGKVITYSSKESSENNKLHLSRKLDINVLLLQQTVYGALRNLFMSVRTGDEQQVVLQPGESVAVN